VVRVRFDDFGRAARSRTLAHATSHTDTVLLAARALLDGLAGELAARGCTLVGLAVANLDDADGLQLPLPFDVAETTALDSAVDGVRERFGLGAVTRAVLLGRPSGPTVPMLPD
jgi:DNA polymerase IV